VPPSAAEQELARVFDEARDFTRFVPAAGRELYLDLVELIINPAAAWIDDDGIVVCPVEGGDDRWQGGTSSRFACPAAVLVRERGRGDLVAPARRALSQVASGILAAAGNGAEFPPGVVDLTAKEFAVACNILRHQVDEATSDAWLRALAAFYPDRVYTAAARMAAGGRPNNYGASACTAEWLRFTLGLTDHRDWVDRHLAHQLPWLTDHGLYRDPGDPMLYDLMVRQNFSELLHYGYDGAHREALDEALRRGGLTTLLTVSPTGCAPYGGRSNQLHHNEAMVAYVCEFQARRWRDRGRADIAGAFKHVARAAAAAAEPFLRLEPFRFLKNRFDPDTRHGKDSGYGEYACYALLAASLFARAALVADDSIPEAAEPIAARGTLVNLWPAFHKTFATCGDSHVAIDTRGQPHYDATGLGRFHRAGAPPELALSMSIVREPKYLVGDAPTDRSVCLGPCWRTLAGQWQCLADGAEHIEHVGFERLEVSSKSVQWRLRWSFASACGLPVDAVTQEFALSPGVLEITATVSGVVDQVGFEVPCLQYDGETGTKGEIAPTKAAVLHQGWRFEAEVADAANATLEEGLRANRNAHYRVARFEAPPPTLAARLRIEPQG